MIRLLFICIIWLSTVVAGRGQSWIVKIFDASSGLPSSECTAVASDHLRHLWVGTTVGLSRYNGYGFENFSEDEQHEYIGKVNVIREDDQHRLWIGADGGLFLKTGDQILKVGSNMSGAQGVNDVVIASGHLFIAAETGPLIIPLDSVIHGRKIRLNDFVVPGWTQSKRLTQVARASDGTLYFAGIHHLFRYTDQGFEALMETQRSNDQIISVMPVDKDRCYVFTSYHEDFYRITGRESEKFTPSVRLGYQGEKPFTITRAMGIYEFDAATETISREVDVSAHGVLWAIRSISVSGMYWMATHDGLVSVKSSGFQEVKFRHPSAYPEVYSMLQTHAGNFYLGSNHGIVFQRRDTTVDFAFDVNPNSEVFDMQEDEHGIWFATGYEGLVYKQGDKVMTFTMKEGLHNNSLNSFFTAGHFLFVTGDGGVTEITRGQHGFSFRPFRIRASRTQFAAFFDGVVAPDGRIWIAGQEGVARIAGDSMALYPLGDKKIYAAAMKKDRTDTLWLAVNGEGIWQCVFNAHGEPEVYRKFRKKESVPVDVFSDLFIDDAQNVWVLHYQGVSVLRRSDRKWLSFDASDGWPFRNYNHLFFYQDHQQNLWAGCSKGLAFVDHHQLLNQHGQPMLFVSATVPSGSLGNNQELAYDDNQLTAKFYAIDFKNQETVTYRYRLDGFNTEWVDAGVNREITFDNLPPGEFMLSVQAMNDKGGESLIATLSFVVEKPFWLRPWFVVCGVLALIAIIYGVVTLREKAVHRKATEKKKREIELLALHRDLAQSQLVALRSQMNPHFIFNALNSVQQFVLQGNADEANRYLSQFARLQRDILNSSDLDFISLEKEVEMLSLYLTLEQVRSGNSFTYSINTPGDIDPGEISIPPMLLQPFVENSIWHGLSEKKGEKRVTVSFSIDPPGMLRCDIEDNGIGRVASAQRKNGDRHGESKGITLIESRMAILRQRYGQRFEMQIVDLTNDRGEVAGTRVSMFIHIGDS